MSTRYSLSTYFLTAMIGGLVTLLLLLVIPTDAKNAWMLGFSKMRFLMIAVTMVSVIPLVWIVYKSLEDKSWLANYAKIADGLLNNDGVILTLLIISVVGLLGGIYFLTMTLLETEVTTKAYYVRLAPITLWLTIIFGQTLLFLIFHNQSAWKRFVQSNKFTLIILPAILLSGLAVHTQIWDEDATKKDIYFLYIEGQRIITGENPYARVLTGNMRENQKYATYFPVFYLLSGITQRFGGEEFPSWLNFWKIVFLLFNVATAYLLFYVPYRANMMIAAIFSGLFWFFNRWTLYATRNFAMDFIAIYFLVLSVILFSKHRWLSLLLFSISLGVKQIAIFLVPVYLIWIWQTAETQQVKNLLFGAIVIASVPLVTSLPFILLNFEGFVKSILFSATRDPTGSFDGVPSMDEILRWSGIIARLPMLLILGLIYFFVGKRNLNRFSTVLLVMVVFVDFNSVLFGKYFAWIIPFFPLTAYEIILSRSNKGLLPA